MGTQKLTNIITGLAFAGALAACGGDPANEYREALPQKGELTVDYPDSGGTTAEDGVGTNTAGLVGGPADLYTATYYESRKINGFGKGVLTLLERITSHPPTTMDETHAVWGPMSADDEPNEFRLTVARIEEPFHYRWKIEGKHKSDAEEDYLPLGGGAFQPDGSGERRGRGFFVVSFDNIHSLNPAENGRGRVAYAFLIAEEGVQVRAAYEGPDADDEIDAAYAFGAGADGNRFVLFALPENIDLGVVSTNDKEAVLIRTRWNDDGGRADVLATKGDLGSNRLHVSQCWDETLVSTYESLQINGVMQKQAGDPTTCSQDDAEIPTAGELEENLPSEEDLENAMNG